MSFTHVIHHSVHIPVAPAVVWEVLRDSAAIASWNPFMTQLEGPFVVGEKLAVTIHSGGRTMSFRPRVVDVEAGRLLRWRGRLGLPGLFDDTHEMRLEPLHGGTRFVHREEFRGLLVPAMTDLLADTSAGFAEMNAALATEAARRQVPTFRPAA